MPSAIVSLYVHVFVYVCVSFCAYVCSRNYRQARTRTQCHLHSLCVTWAFILFASGARTELKFYEFLWALCSSLKRSPHMWPHFPLSCPLAVVKCCRQLTRATKKHNPKTITNIPLRHIRVVFRVREHLSLYPSYFLSICLSHSFPSSVIKVCITFYCSLKRSLCRIRGTCTHMLPLPIPTPRSCCWSRQAFIGAALGHSGCQVYRIK